MALVLFMRAEFGSLFIGGDNLFDLKDVRPKGFKRTRRVNGEKVIEFTAIPMPENESTFDLIVEEASVNALDDKYIIKKLTEQSRGKKYIKQVTAIHKFYVDLINKQQPAIHNGSITFNNYMNLVFEDTGYTFVAVDSFPAREFENLGNDNRLALLQKGLERFQAEFELVGNQVRFYKQIGNDTDFQFRYGHNIKAINVDIDTTNLATRIRGTGDPELGIEAEYTSPNSAIYGIIDAPPVNDERFKHEETLLEEMKRRLIDEPEISITVDFVDLRAAGYPYTVPNEGDRVWLIYEPMNDLLIETRIVEIVEYFKYDEEKDEFVVIKTEVTLSNDRKSFAGTMFDSVRKQLRQIVNDDGIIRYSALDEAVKIATEALHSAQTELEFNNGIIAREKSDPNRLVVLNSAGLGISKDGGQTFQEAITADGFVLSVGAVGRLSANHIQIGPETEFLPNYDPSTKETPEGAQQKVDALRDAVNEDLDDLSEGLGDFMEYVDTVFHDGIIEESEAKAIEKYINSLNAEKADIDAQYSSIYLNSHLEGSAKTNLLNAKVNYNGAHNELINAINAAIADGKTTPEEKANVDNKFTIYRNALATLSTRFEQALDNIAQNKAAEAEENAKGYADREYGPVKDTVEQNQNVWNRAAIFNEDGTLNTNVLKGVLTDEQIESAARWNAQGTYIDENGVYTGIIVAEQIVGGSLIGEEFYGGTFKGAEFEQVGTDGSMLVDDDGIKIFNKAGDLRAAILLGGTQGIENTLGLTLINNNESVFEINQDGQYAKINSKISLVMKSEKEMMLDVSRKPTGAANIRKLLNIRTHIDGSNYRDELVLYRDEQYDEAYSGFNVGNDIFLGNTANIENARFLIGVGKNPIYNFQTLFISYLNGANLIDVPFSINGGQQRIDILYDVYYKGIPLSTSTEKNKLFMKPLKINPYNILQLNLYDWYDKKIYEQNEKHSSNDSKLLKLATPPVRRIAGLSAEEVHENGLGTFVYYDDNENISGLMYDKLWTLLIPITKDHENRLNEYDLRFGTIESKIDKLERELEQLKGAI